MSITQLKLVALIDWSVKTMFTNALMSLHSGTLNRLKHVGWHRDILLTLVADYVSQRGSSLGVCAHRTN